MHKMEYKDSVKIGGVKEKPRDLVIEKSKIRDAIDYVVRKSLVAWGDASSESNLDLFQIVF